MQIDWLTVAAQVVNFLVLVFLLRHFLYRPVIDAIAAREHRIAERMAEAAVREKAAAARKAEYEHQIAALAQAREQRVAQAEDEAEARGRALLDKARGEIAATEARWRTDLAREQDEFLGDLRRDLAAGAQSIARQAMADLADAGLEETMIARALARLESLDATARKELAADPEGVTVLTTFDLEAARQGALTRKLHGVFGQEVTIRYARSDELECGIELRGAGRRVAWSFADYLAPVARRIEARLTTAARAAAES